MFEADVAQFPRGASSEWGGGVAPNVTAKNKTCNREFGKKNSTPPIPTNLAQFTNEGLTLLGKKGKDPP